MSAHQSLLKLMLNRKNYESYISCVKVGILSEEERILLNDFGDFYKTHKDINEINIEDFVSWFSHCKHKTFSDDALSIYTILLNRLDKCNPDVLQDVLQSLNKEYYTQRIQEHLEKGFSEDYLKTLLDEYNKSVENKDLEAFVVQDNFQELFNKDVLLNGYKWFLDCLNKSVGPLNKGDFGIVAAHTGQGKTSFCANQAVYLINQLKDDDIILWFNNEGAANKIKRRIYGVGLQKTTKEILDNLPELTKNNTKMIEKIHRIKVINASGKTLSFVERSLKYWKPKLIFIDQLDNFLTKSTVDHLKLEQLYQEARELAIEYCPIIAVSQLSASVTYTTREEPGILKFMQHPQVTHLKDSRTGKAGAVDFVIMLAPDNVYENIRHLHVAKTKSEMNELGDHVKRELLFDASLGIYRE